MAPQPSFRMVTVVTIGTTVIGFFLLQLWQSTAISYSDQVVGRTVSTSVVEPLAPAAILQRSTDILEVSTSLPVGSKNDKTPQVSGGNYTLDFAFDPLHGLQKRVGEEPIEAADTKQFIEYKQKGAWLKCIMKTPEAAKDKATSPYGSYTFFSTWGWQEMNGKDDRGVNTAELPVEGIADLVSDDTGFEYEWRHMREAKPPGVEPGISYPATQATYANIFFPKAGIVVANLNEGPDHMVKEGRTDWQLEDNEWDPQKQLLPKLRQWSDVVYLTWAAIAKPDIKKLNVVIRRGISNPDTIKVLASVLKKKWATEGGRAPRFPDKRVITPESDRDGFNALLYTPNVRGVVWLLVQHHENTKLGKKEIISIEAYEETHTFGYSPSLLIRIKDVQPAEVAEPAE